ncbi:MAG: hypothetical protein NZ455_11955 [Bacteroidia bacterium]|nr:hypothetical protein [Bacteroidia bacterium]MDW8348382.1 hypothetical protein [Bacteroidia bacterium]
MLSEIDKKILKLYHSDGKMEAIKWTMQVMQSNLKTATDYVNNLLEKNSGYVPALEKNDTLNSYNNNELDEMMIKLYKEGKKIEAIQMLMQIKKWGLKQSKDYIENLIDKK